MTMINSTITAGGTEQTIFTPDANRPMVAWMVRNESSGDLRVTDNGTAPATSTGILIKTGEAYEEVRPGRGPLKIWGATTSQAFSAKVW